MWRMSQQSKPQFASGSLLEALDDEAVDRLNSDCRFTEDYEVDAADVFPPDESESPLTGPSSYIAPDAETSDDIAVKASAPERPVCLAMINLYRRSNRGLFNHRLRAVLRRIIMARHASRSRFGKLRHRRSGWRIAHNPAEIRKANNWFRVKGRPGTGESPSGDDASDEFRDNARAGCRFVTRRYTIASQQPRHSIRVVSTLRVSIPNGPSRDASNSKELPPTGMAEATVNVSGPQFDQGRPTLHRASSTGSMLSTVLERIIRVYPIGACHAER